VKPFPSYDRRRNLEIVVNYIWRMAVFFSLHECFFTERGILMSCAGAAGGVCIFWEGDGSLGVRGGIASNPFNELRGFRIMQY